MNIVITGASSGIGEALAEHYAAPGVTLGITGRDEARLNSIAERLREKGAFVAAHVVDVCDHDAMASWLTQFDHDHPIDLLIANAGVGVEAKDPTEDALNAARGMFDINMYGVLNTIDPVIPIMAVRGRGQIAMMASIAGYRGLPSAPAYCASKGFVKLYGEGLRGSLATHGIKVNVICPGFVRSRITDKNRCPMPFFMEGDRAAKIIARGIQKNKARVVFPWPMAFSVWFLSALPSCVADWLLRHIPNKT